MCTVVEGTVAEGETAVYTDFMVTTLQSDIIYRIISYIQWCIGQRFTLLCSTQSKYVAAAEVMAYSTPQQLILG